MKRIEYTDTGTGTIQRTVLATFRVVDGAVVADWADEDYRVGIEGTGIVDDEGRNLRLRDGIAFYDALDGEYVNSSRVHVVSDDPR